MALRMSPVSRNLHAKVTLLGLELEDMLFLAMASAVAMLVGQFFFADRYMFFLPMNWFLMLMVREHYGTRDAARLCLHSAQVLAAGRPVRSLWLSDFPVAAAL
jgi:hypothetical protein